MTDQERADHNAKANHLQARIQEEQQHWTDLAKEAEELGYVLHVHNVTLTEIGVQMYSKEEWLKQQNL